MAEKLLQFCRNIGLFRLFGVSKNMQVVDFFGLLSASQAEREGSIPSTRSSIRHKALSGFRHPPEIDGFTGSFTPPVPGGFLCAS